MIWSLWSSRGGLFGQNILLKRQKYCPKIEFISTAIFSEIFSLTLVIQFSMESVWNMICRHEVFRQNSPTKNYEKTWIEWERVLRRLKFICIKFEHGPLERSYKMGHDELTQTHSDTQRLYKQDERTNFHIYPHTFLHFWVWPNFVPLFCLLCLYRYTIYIFGQGKAWGIQPCTSLEVEIGPGRGGSDDLRPRAFFWWPRTFRMKFHWPRKFCIELLPISYFSSVWV